MKPLHELLKGKVVNCQTEEEAKEFFSLLHDKGYKWCDNSSLIGNLCYNYKEKTCYNTNSVFMKVRYCDKDYYEKETSYGIITYKQFKQLINENNMETKEVKIQVPEGYEIDKENSTFELIKFKPIKKVLTYEDVAEELFKDKKGYYTNKFGTILPDVLYDSQYLYINNCTSEKQVQKLLAINKLMNVARYLNGDWQPNWGNNDGHEYKYYLFIDYPGNKIEIAYIVSCCSDGIYFKSEELAQQAIGILGEETIKLALSTDW